MERVRTIKVAILNLIFIMISGIIMPIKSDAEAKEVLKVAAWEREGALHIEDDGTITGIEADTLYLMTKYTGYKFEFVVIEDSEDAFEMLEKGEIDILPSMKKTEEREENYDFTKETSRQSIMALYGAANSPYAYQEYEALNNKRIAYLEASSINKNEFDYIYEKIENPVLIPYDNLNDIHEALKNGKVDAAISELPNVQEDEIIVDRYNPTGMYYISRKGSGIKEILDYSLITIKTIALDEYGQYLNDFNPRSSVVEFTREELNYIESNPKLRVAVLNDSNDMSIIDENGKLIGILPDVIYSLKEISGLNLELVIVSEGSNLPSMIKNGKTEMSLGMLRTENFVSDSDFVYCDVVLETSHILIIDKYENFSLGDAHVIGIPKTFVAGVEYLSKNYPNWEIVYPDDGEELLDLLESGTADCIINQKYAYTYYMTKYNLEGYTMYPEDFWETECNLVVSSDMSPLLISILNKSILMLKNDQLNNIIDNNEAEITYTPTFIEALSLYKTYYLIILLALLIVMFAFVHFHGRKMKQSKRLIEINNDLIKANKIAEETTIKADEMKILAENANRIKSDFIARMSHDMRTPMSAIIGLSEIGIEEVPENPGHRYFEKINESAEYLLDLVDDVLDIQKIQSGEIVLQPEVAMMGGCAQKVLTVVSPRASQKGLNLITKLEYKDYGEAIKIDQKRMEQLLINILNNAIKYTPAGGTVTWKSYSTHLNEGNIVVTHEISDTGVGMSEEFQKKMFEPFSQEFNQESKSEGGTGLGLAICKNLVDAMDGSIKCKSKLGIGTTFVISVNLGRPTDEELTVFNNKIKDVDLPTATLKGKRVLLCEDVAVNAEIVMKLLNKVGIDVLHADNGSIGVKMVGEQTFDAIIMDIRMPIMDGLTASKKIRQFDKEIPIIALSANAYAEDVEKSINAGMNAHISKPIDKDELYQTLLQLIK